MSILLPRIVRQARAVGWTQDDLEEYAMDHHQVRLSEISREHAFRLYKSLCELEKFHAWRQLERARRASLNS